MKPPPVMKREKGPNRDLKMATANSPILMVPSDQYLESS